MNEFLVKLLALGITFGIYAFAGWRGWVVGIVMILIFEWILRRVYGKSIAEIAEADVVHRPAKSSWFRR